MKIYKLISSAFIALMAAGCGGGGSSGGSGEIANTGAAIITINGDGFNYTDSVSTVVSSAQNSTSGYSTITNTLFEWTGSSMGYTAGYATPTSGILKTFSVTKRINSESIWSVSNLNYDISRSTPSVYSDTLPVNAITTAAETKFYGGNNNDTSYYLSSTSEIDLGAGNDTLVHSQNYLSYQFQRVVGSSTSVNVIRDGHSTLVRNVETFRFANITKTISEILATLP